MNKLLTVDPLSIAGATARMLCIYLHWSGSTAKFRIFAQALLVELLYYLDIFYTAVLSCLMLEPRSRKLLDQVRDAIRVKHYSYSTEKTYVYWIRHFILFHNKRHSNEIGTPEVTQFLTHLAMTEQVTGKLMDIQITSLKTLHYGLQLLSYVN